jgi:integrase
VSVYKRGKTWYVEFIQNGVRVKRSAGRAATRATAAAFERQLRHELDAGSTVRAQRTFDEAITRWLNGEAKGLRDHSLSSDIRRVLPFATGRSLGDAVEVAEDVRAALHAEGRKPATVNRKLGVVRRLCALAYQWRWIDSNLAERIPLEVVHNTREEYMAPEHVEAFAARVRPELGRLVRAAYACGLRLGELERLQPGDLTIDGKVGWLYVAPGKNGRSRRVPVLEHDFGLFDPLPFRFSRQQLKDDWDKARRLNGLTQFRFHDVRHAYATRLAGAGAGTAQIAALLGHSDLRTAQRYVQRPDENLLAAVLKLAPPRAGGGSRRRGKKRSAPRTSPARPRSKRASSAAST